MTMPNVINNSNHYVCSVYNTQWFKMPIHSKLDNHSIMYSVRIHGNIIIKCNHMYWSAPIKGSHYRLLNYFTLQSPLLTLTWDDGRCYPATVSDSTEEVSCELWTGWSWHCWCGQHTAAVRDQDRSRNCAGSSSTSHPAWCMETV